MPRPTGISSLSASVETICVDPARVDEVWPHARKFIAAAVERCGATTEYDIAKALSFGALLWIRTDGLAIHGAGVTQLITGPLGLTCDVMAYGGPCDDWPAAFTPIERYAKAEGCTAIRIEGRQGWKRIFRDYELTSITLTKRLT